MTDISKMLAKSADISKISTDRIDGLDEELQKVSQPGDICYSLRSEKQGWLLCNGQAVSRTIYSELFATIGTTYGNGDGSTTFNVPDYRGKFLQMVDSNSSVGDEKEAGLPNITGSVSNNSPNVNGQFLGDISTTYLEESGALYCEFLNIARLTIDNTSNYADAIDTISFDASRSNSIYGNSSTVQPPAFMVNYFIKY